MIIMSLKTTLQKWDQITAAHYFWSQTNFILENEKKKGINYVSIAAFKIRMNTLPTLKYQKWFMDK